MQSLWPPGATGNELTADELAAVYAYPDQLDRPYLRVNFVSSLDGSVAVQGLSGGLSSAPDRVVFGLLRELCEVVLVGAGTARAEGYRGARKPSRATGRPPRIAVVTSSAQLDPHGPLLTDTSVPPLVLTTTAAPAENLDRLVAAGAEIDTRGTGPHELFAALAERGLNRVLCEGGPSLFGQLIAADAVDELCLTWAPLLAGGDAGRISRGSNQATRGMRLASLLTEQDVLLAHYRRDRAVP
ncbi:MAG TPA: pyrimidine reductase family protein [Pseudonocardia sp.]